MKVLVTADFAKSILELNRNNRLLRPRTLRRLRKAMRSPNWQPDPDGAILISDKGKLLNGQHQLTVLVELGQPREPWIQYNVSERRWKRKKARHRKALYRAVLDRRKVKKMEGRKC